MGELAKAFDEALREHFLTPEYIKCVEDAKKFLKENPWIGQMAAECHVHSLLEDFGQQ